MTVVLLEPHHDDAVLFAAYTLMGYRPLVVTVMGASADIRPGETREAFGLLEVTHQCWPHPEVSPDYGTIKSNLTELQQATHPSRVFAPAVEDGGHQQHNAVGRLAAEVFGSRVEHYLTYRRGHGRTRSDLEVVPEPGWVALKLRAMACYASQIERDNTRYWFTSDWSREWMQDA